MPPAACLAITFTRRAAAELRERLAALLPKDAADVPVHTFHSLGLTILREQPNAAGLQRGFRVADDSERLNLLSAALGVTERKSQAMLASMSRAKRTREPVSEETRAALTAYGEALASRNWIDFDDLVGLSLRALEAEPGLVAFYRDRFRWISVDEFQDVDEQQYALLKLLAPPTANLCAIGDPNQAIYGFRGADADRFARFRDDYPGAAMVHLARNYRSSGTIVSAAAQVIEPVDGDSPAAQIVRDMLDRITIHAAPTAAAEAEFVVHSIEQLLGGHNFFSIDSARTGQAGRADLSFADFAVLYRTDAQSAVLGEAFARSGMPFRRHSQARLTDRPDVRGLLQSLAAGPEDLTIAAHLERAADRGDIDSALLAQLKNLAAGCGDDRARFAEQAALATEADGWDPRADRISLLTLHAAKGLEFPVVFIVGLEDGILPLHWGAGADDPAEERRLFYVGMTRAEDRLFLCRALKRAWRGSLRALPASPYLTNIAEELLRQSRRDAPARRSATAQMDLF